jgi:hypothetical protein
MSRMAYFRRAPATKPSRLLRKSLCCALVSLCIASVSRPGRAQTPEGEVNNRVEWREEWPRFHAWEYAATGASLGGLAAIVLFAPRPDRASAYENPFDTSMRRAFRAESRAGRDHARTAGDVGFRFLNFYPYFDSLVVAGLIHWNADVALQTTLINTEAFAIAGFVSIGFERLVGRARPSARECHSNPGYERFCGDDDSYSSLLSGHTAIAFAGAGVTCAHHTHLPLYGSRAAGIAACVTSVGLATVSGAARVVNDRHWASDLVFAAAIGSITGYVLPVSLHYRSASDTRASRDEPRWSVVPDFGPGHATVRLVAFM